MMSDFWIKVDKTVRHHGRNLMRGIRGTVWDVHHTPMARPVFVIGCSRAGTTLVYKTLSESPELGTLQRETHDFWMDLHPLTEKNWDTHALTRADASARGQAQVARYFYSHTGHRRFVDKNNQNGLCVAYLQALFPDACFVYVKRNPGDNINSLIEGWGKPDEFATWSAALPASVAIENGRYRQWCFFIAEGWRSYLNSSIEEVCAFQYRVMNEAILRDRALIPAGQWAEVFYEDLVRDPVGNFRRLFEAFDLRFDQRLEQPCAEVLSPPYNAFSEIRLDKWRGSRNAERIEHVMDRVADVARRMGY